MKTESPSIGVKRLLKLAEHLEYGTLGHEVFDFESINDGASFDANGCGTHGCAMGELPFVFPDQWKFKPDGELTAILLDDQEPYTDAEVAKFFGIEQDDVVFLFYPGPTDIGRSGLPGNASPQRVAVHIREFVAARSDKAGER